MKNSNKTKKILAIICLVAIAALLIFSAIVAVFDFPNKLQIFSACVITLIFLPILSWIYIWLYGVLTKRKTIASFRTEEMDKTIELAEQIKEETTSTDSSN